MRIEFDAALCDAHGQCVIVAPELFDLGDDDDAATLLDPQPGERLRGQAQAAADACPAAAIALAAADKLPR
ncbi:ferredoxin [Murinocardiopsis flavida]|uniref:Ferredoxin n=1 Tax=Murinocardiopsis flavida TaxID=645275 RepID=A0A2P8CWR6_9ACTN|nr:ferredoxin [Murinocardiopsis flavida]PSK89424.1 ferredoxin [Murinocardiopsis flavida]